MGEEMNKYTKQLERPPDTNDCSLHFLEEYTLETDKPLGRYLTKLTIYHRRSDDMYFGELYIDRDYQEGKTNGATCTFQHTSLTSLHRYISQFRDLISEEGRKSIKITQVVAGHKPRVTHTQGAKERSLNVEQQQQRQAALIAQHKQQQQQLQKQRQHQLQLQLQQQQQQQQQQVIQQQGTQQQQSHTVHQSPQNQLSEHSSTVPDVAIQTISMPQFKSNSQFSPNIVLADSSKKMDNEVTTSCQSATVVLARNRQQHHPTAIGKTHVLHQGTPQLIPQSISHQINQMETNTQQVNQSQPLLITRNINLRNLVSNQSQSNMVSVQQQSHQTPNKVNIGGQQHIQINLSQALADNKLLIDKQQLPTDRLGARSTRLHALLADGPSKENPSKDRSGAQLIEALQMQPIKKEPGSVKVDITGSALPTVSTVNASFSQTGRSNIHAGNSKPQISIAGTTVVSSAAGLNRSSSAPLNINLANLTNLQGTLLFSFLYVSYSN